MPNGRVPPLALGMSTRRTGGGKSLPEDSRFQSLWRFPARPASNSAIDCPSTPAAPWLAVTLSKASQTSRFGMSNGFALVTRRLPSPVGRLPQQDAAAPSVQSHYRTFTPTAGCSAPRAPHRCSGSCGGLPLERLPSHRGDRFPRSATEPDPGSRHLQAGRRSGRTSGLLPNASRRPLPSLRFRHRPVNFASSSAVRFRKRQFIF